jgi:signal transduction histidine kinase
VIATGIGIATAEIGATVETEEDEAAIAEAGEDAGEAEVDVIATGIATAATAAIATDTQRKRGLRPPRSFLLDYRSPFEVPAMPDGPAAPQSQVAELAELAGGFIHEIKNRVGTLSLNLQLLAEDFEQPESPRERRALDRVNRLHGECQKLVDLASDFLRFARVHELHTEPTTLDEVVTRLRDFLAPTARQRSVEIEWFAAADLPPVNLDRDLFEQCLLNLMLNAEQAMPDGGKLTLIGRLEDGVSASESASVSVSARKEKHDTTDSSGLAHTHTHTSHFPSTSHWVCLDVIDTGCGIPADQLPKLFRPFHTTKEKGHGLGLATTRKIVHAHGGTIGVQSEPGRGTKFTIRLPAAHEPELRGSYGDPSTVEPGVSAPETDAGAGVVTD